MKKDNAKATDPKKACCIAIQINYPNAKCNVQNYNNSSKTSDVQMKCSIWIVQMICSSAGIYLANRWTKISWWMDRVEIYSSQNPYKHWNRGRKKKICALNRMYGPGKHEIEEEKKSRQLNANGIYFWFIRINNYNGRLYWHTNTNANTNKSNVKCESRQTKAHFSSTTTAAAAVCNGTIHLHISSINYTEWARN